MDLKLIQIEDEKDFKEFKLCNENNEQIVSFDVEVNKETALISYETQDRFKHQGYASKGLKLLKDTLFNDDSILFLELINLSGDYSRKVAENAGFFSPSHTLDYYILPNPRAEEIVNNKLGTLDVSSIAYKRLLREIDKINSLRHKENLAKEELRNKLEQLLQQRELIEPGDYKEYVESEISHLEKILGVSQEQNIEKKMK